MAIVRRPEPFVIGRTKPSFVALEGGWRRYDLRPHMRVDIVPAIKKRGDFNYLFPPTDQQSKIVNFARQDEYEGDFLKHQLIKRAKDFQFRDPDGSSILWDQEGYRKRLEFLWHAPLLRIDLTSGFLPQDASSQSLKLTYSIENDYKAALCIPKEEWEGNFDLEIMKIMSERNWDYLLRIFGWDADSRERGKQIIWDGDDSKKNNFWRLFKYNKPTDSGQIDDRRDPIKELMAQPAGYFSLSFEYPGKLTFERKRNAAFITAIIRNLPFLELRE